MNNKNIIMAAVLIAAIWAAIYFYRENEQSKRRIAELEEDKLKRNPVFSAEIGFKIQKTQNSNDSPTKSQAKAK